MTDKNETANGVNNTNLAEIALDDKKVKKIASKIFDLAKELDGGLRKSHPKAHEAAVRVALAIIHFGKVYDAETMLLRAEEARDTLAQLEAELKEE